MVEGSGNPPLFVCNLFLYAYSNHEYTSLCSELNDIVVKLKISKSESNRREEESDWVKKYHNIYYT